MNSPEELTAFRPGHEFFAGIDSDGTAFDSMNIKHLKAFIPAGLKIWDFGERAADFKNIMAHINLYSRNRGINRFAGLLMAFERLEAETGTASGTGAVSPVFDVRPLKEYMESGGVLSNAALEIRMKEKTHPFLDALYQWSLEADRLFEEHTRGLRPFLNVMPALEIMAPKADIMVISSAPGAGLDKDWSCSGLGKYIALMAGQETGSKKNQIALGASGKYSPQKMLMIGDAPGDLDAARSVESSFYPVIPGREEESWIRLREDGLPRFFAGTYRGNYEEKLIEKFFAVLEK
jgi:phosphoglycolate phosphatase-like HAD superfamily hydrolase